MKQIVELPCACGRVRLMVERSPIVTVECCCSSCRTAGPELESLPGAPRVVEPNGATHLVLYRKDRIRVVQGVELLKEHRLTPRSSTRRVVASCCNTPMFMDFTKGHWLSLYSALWPLGTVPPIEMRTMTSDAPAGVTLSDVVPNPKTHTALFFVKLLGAWAAMGFRIPKLPANGKLDA